MLLFGSIDQRGQRHVLRGKDHGRQARGGGVHMCGGRVAARGQNRVQVSDEIWATIVDHVINYGLYFREAR